MKLLTTCTMLLSLSAAVPAFSQTAGPAAAQVGNEAPIDLTGFRDAIASKNKALADKVNAEKAIVKKNGTIIQDVKKIDAANKKLEAERKALAAQNAIFEEQRREMLLDQPDAANTSAVTYTRTYTPPPARTAPAAPAVPVTHLENVGRTVIPPGAVLTSPAERQAAASETRSTPAAAPVQVQTPAPSPLAAAPAPQATPQPTQQATLTPQPTLTPQNPTAQQATATVVSSGPVRVAESVSMGMLLTPLRPVYPQTAQSFRIEGSVVLDAVISRSGQVESVRAVSGPEMLRKAAMDAVQTAHYQPYQINGDSVQMATTITVVFRMRS